MYVTQRPNDVVALDAKTGRAFWIYRHAAGRPGRLLRLEQSRPRDLGDTLFMARSTRS